MKLFPVVILAIAVWGMYLQSQSKLIPTLRIVFEPDAGNLSMGEFVVALIVFVAMLSMIPDERTGFALTLLVVLGALMYNHQKKGSNDAIGTLLGK